MKSRVYYSGHGGRTCDPEVVIQGDRQVAHIMLSFHDHRSSNTDEGKGRLGRLLKKRQAKLSRRLGEK